MGAEGGRREGRSEYEIAVRCHGHAGLRELVQGRHDAAKRRSLDKGLVAIRNILAVLVRLDQLQGLFEPESYRLFDYVGLSDADRLFAVFRRILLQRQVVDLMGFGEDRSTELEQDRLLFPDDALKLKMVLVIILVNLQVMALAQLFYHIQVYQNERNNEDDREYEIHSCREFLPWIGRFSWNCVNAV